jgi:hypothetical protein
MILLLALLLCLLNSVGVKEFPTKQDLEVIIASAGLYVIVDLAGGISLVFLTYKTFNCFGMF